MTEVQAKTVSIGEVAFGGTEPLAVIAGPCQIESRTHALRMARELRAIADETGLGLVFKASYDKANRTALSSPRGVGMEEGLRILEEVRSETGLSVLSDVHAAEQCAPAAKALDALQIPAFLCRQTDLLVAAAKTGRAVLVKKGQFLAPGDMANVADKLDRSGNGRVLLCERGTSFGYNNLVVDMRGLSIMRKTGYPVVFDATHSAQAPGGLGSASGGDREFAPLLARAAVAAGVDGVFIETHDDPDRAPSDGAVMVRLRDLRALLKSLLRIDAVRREVPCV